jgi:hypothetical protein
MAPHASAPELENRVICLAFARSKPWRPVRRRADVQADRGG